MCLWREKKSETELTAIIVKQDSNMQTVTKEKEEEKELILVRQYKMCAHFQGKPFFLNDN